MSTPSLARDTRAGDRARRTAPTTRTMTGSGVERRYAATASTITPQRRRKQNSPAKSVRGRRIPQAQQSGVTFRERFNTASTLVSRVPFPVVVAALLVVGIGFALFLSARSTEDTYAIRAAQQYNETLVERRDQLLTEIEGERSAESLARRAQELGLVSVINAPIIVRNPDGTTRVAGNEEVKLGEPVSPLQAGTSKPPTGPDARRDAGARFGLPPGHGTEPGRGGLTVPYPNGNSPVPDLGAGRRVDTPPVMPEAPAPPPPAPLAGPPAPPPPPANEAPMPPPPVPLADAPH